MSSDFPPGIVGGTGQWAFGLTEAFASLGHDVTVFTQASSVRRSRRHDGAAYRIVPMGDLEWKRLRSLYGAYHAARIVFSGRFDLVVCSHWVYGTLPVFLSRWYPVKTVVAALGSEVVRKRNPFEAVRFRFTMRKAALTLAISRFTRDRIVERTGMAEDEIAVIPCGVDFDRFRPVPDVSDLRRRWNLGGGPVILTLGAVRPKKNQETVIRAMPGILRRHPTATYLIAGPVTPSEEGRLRDLARECGVENRVVLTGVLEDAEIARVHHLADVFVMVTRQLGAKFEGFGIVFVEAGACGKPAIGARSGGIPDAVLEGRTGLLAESTDVADVAEKVLLLLDDPDRRRSLGAAGRRRAEEELTWPLIARRILERLA